MALDPIEEINAWRKYYIGGARRMMQQGYPITARQCLKNAQLMKELVDKEKSKVSA